MPRQLPPRIVISASPYGSLTHMLECARILTPLNRISIVVPPRVAACTRVETAWYDGVELIVQVRDQPTTDVLIPLAHVFARDPLAPIVFLPAEFSIAEPHLLAHAIRATLAQPHPHTISVLGMPPFEWRSGSQWNPVIALGQVTAFWDALREQAPQHAAALEHYVQIIDRDDAGTALIAAYQQLPPLELAKDLLSKRRGVEVSALTPAELRSSHSNLLAVLARGRRNITKRTEVQASGAIRTELTESAGAAASERRMTRHG